MWNKFYIFLILTILTTTTTYAWSGRVVSVTDGDTAKIVRADTGIQVKVRFAGIDAPEKKQAYGRKAKRFVTNLIGGKTLKVEPITKDRYGRTVAYLWMGGKEINLKIVKAGYAWVYRKYKPKPKARAELYFSAEQAARSKGLGLWNDPHPVPPWKWRRR